MALCSHLGPLLKEGTQTLVSQGRPWKWEVTVLTQDTLG